MGLAGGLLLCSSLFAAPPDPKSVTLAWDPSPTDPTNVAGYNLYWGPAHATYTNHLFVPGWSTLTASITNLQYSSLYFFNITAVGTNGSQGLESIYDGEVSTTTPAPPPVPALPVSNLRIRLTP